MPKDESENFFSSRDAIGLMVAAGLVGAVIVGLTWMLAGSQRAGLRKVTDQPPETISVGEITSGPTPGSDPDTTPPDPNPEPAQPAPPAPIRVGAGVLADAGFSPLQGQRVGLITNDAATVDGERVVDLLVRSGVEVVALFAPEHGLEATVAAGAPVADGQARVSGSGSDDPSVIPVHSLYGTIRAPSQRALVGLDVLVFDLQDVGVRAYTYTATMGLSMVAAAEAGVPFMVLDRPNPLGGVLIDGFVTDDDQGSFVSRYPIPAVHGMTAGELALAIKGEGWLDGLDGLELEVVGVDGWSRPMLWGDTGLSWSAPSPSLPTPSSVAAYPVTVGLEATTMSVGRGSAEPFALIGAPWLDAQAAAAELNGRRLTGVRVEATTFTARASTAVPEPVYPDQEIPGVRLVVTDPGQYQPALVGLHVLEVLGAQARDRGVVLIDRPEAFDRLAGSDRLRLGLAAGQGPEEIAAGWADELAAFAELRRAYLLY